ncbi:RNA polymerase sigma factor [Porticoccus sp. W117]|uniref:RNA polymerase sigma factor n=1 Tax=Porticoccus sp. W117 TaxID=3054777 RepID=UPI00259641B3|nr:RNA polymerase sigma factor [Porticoccus sp. W117]MDM3872271.1 RNA polymerase sigma factor [Porticoccus sp. W117]
MSRKSLSTMSSFFIEHSPFLKKFLAKFLTSEHDIEDVAQEAYLKAYCAEKDRGAIEHPKAFLFTIAKNLALNELNKKSRQMTKYLEDCEQLVELDKNQTPDDQVEAAETLGIYCEAIANLPEKTRRVYLMRKVHGLPHKEIARRLAISLSSVEKHLRSGVLSCRDHIDSRQMQIDTKTDSSGHHLAATKEVGK